MNNPLTTVRNINARIWENVNNRGGYVYAEVPGVPEPVRITRARSVADELQVKTLGDGRWIRPFRVWQECGTIGEQTICESCNQIIDANGLKAHVCPPLRVGKRFQHTTDSLLKGKDT